METHGNDHAIDTHFNETHNHYQQQAGAEKIYFADDLNAASVLKHRRRHSNSSNENITVSDLFLQKDSSTRSQLSSSSSPSRHSPLPSLQPLHSSDSTQQKSLLRRSSSHTRSPSGQPQQDDTLGDSESPESNLLRQGIPRQQRHNQLTQ
jgi:hypothetical protein